MAQGVDRAGQPRDIAVGRVFVNHALARGAGDGAGRGFQFLAGGLNIPRGDGRPAFADAMPEMGGDRAVALPALGVLADPFSGGMSMSQSLIPQKNMDGRYLRPVMIIIEQKPMVSRRVRGSRRRVAGQSQDGR